MKPTPEEIEGAIRLIRENEELVIRSLTPVADMLAALVAENDRLLETLKEAKKMLDLLRCTPPVPGGRLVGAGDHWQVRDGYDVAILVDGTGLSQFAHRRARHEPSMWRVPTAETSEPFSRAPVTRGSFPVSGGYPNFRAP